MPYTRRDPVSPLPPFYPAPQPEGAPAPGVAGPPYAATFPESFHPQPGATNPQGIIDPAFPAVIIPPVRIVPPPFPANRRDHGEGLVYVPKTDLVYGESVQAEYIVADLGGDFNVPASWKAGGGTITRDGYFIAGTVTGSFDIVATSAVREGRTAWVRISVRNREVVEAEREAARAAEVVRQDAIAKGSVEVERARAVSKAAEVEVAKEVAATARAAEVEAERVRVAGRKAGAAAALAVAEAEKARKAAVVGTDAEAQKAATTVRITDESKAREAAEPKAAKTVLVDEGAAEVAAQAREAQRKAEAAVRAREAEATSAAAVERRRAAIEAAKPKP